MKNYYLSILLLLAGLSVRAQTYELQVDTAAVYTSLQNAVVLTDFVWDDPTLAIPLGFDFQLFDSTYSTLYLNGDIGLGGIIAPFGDNAPQAAFPLLIPFGDDLIDRGALDGSGISKSPIQYQISGDPGARILKMEWRNAGFFSDDANKAFVNFQMWLYETSNIIEYRFGPSEVPDPAVFELGTGPIFGLVGGYNEISEELDEAYFLVGNPSIPVLLTDVDIDTDTFWLDEMIPDGTIYRFGKELPSTTSLPEGPRFTVYPNPASDEINIRFDQNVVILEVRLLDNNGRLVRRSVSDVRRINAGDLPAGVYTLQLFSNQGFSSRRVIKQ